VPYIDWLGKDDVVNHHKNIPYKTISCKEEIGDENSQNLIIKGDNLLALKSLLPYYANSVKMIYIDPPYNTGNTSWVYNDNMDSPLIKKWLNDTVNAEDLSRSDKWLCMMYPRLKLLRELLKEDGVIFISIDDAEVAHLRMICDDIFGSENFITNMIWEKKHTRSNDAKYFSDNHDHILVYSKEKSKFKINKFFRTEEQNKSYKNPDNDPRGVWMSQPIQVKTPNDAYMYKITNPVGKEFYPPQGRSWQFSEKRYFELVQDNKIWFGEKGENVPRIKKFLSEVSDGIVPLTIWYRKDVGDNQLAKDDVKVLLPNSSFDTPKPSKLIRNLIHIGMNKEDIILDSFAGSGTTAQAVIEQNQEDGGNRKFILIETLDYAKDITAERVKRVIEGYPFKGKDKTTLFEKKLTTTQLLNPSTMEKLSSDVSKLIESETENYTKIEKTFKDSTLKVEGVKEIKAYKDGLGGGFKYCELAEDIFDEFGELNSKLTFEDIAKHIYFVEFKKPIVKDDISKPFVGSFHKKHIYFFEDRFKISDMKKILRTHDDYTQIIVYTKRTTISEDELQNNHIVVRYIPYDIKDN
jgi:adenine-specific DNA-methyltransferase